MSNYKLLKGDCLELMKDIPDNSIDLVLCDLPYGATASNWDRLLPLDKLWEQYRRIVVSKGAIVLFASEPFATILRSNALDLYKYDWIWDKTRCSNFQVMNYQPGRRHELICVFSKAKACYTSNNNSMNYYPQKIMREKPIKNGGGLNNCKLLHNNSMKKQYSIYVDKHPTTILNYKIVTPKERLHPTQKPVALLEYLIKTYTNEGDLVLDNCMGSGSTGVACMNTNRNFIGIELDENYFNIAKERIKNEVEE